MTDPDNIMQQGLRTVLQRAYLDKLVRMATPGAQEEQDGGYLLHPPMSRWERLCSGVRYRWWRLRHRVGTWVLGYDPEED